jgi:primosomal protein N' (replication factor Y)
MSDPCREGASDPERRVVVDVLPPVAVDVAYSYRAPARWGLAPGQFVAVPLGARRAVGVVWATREGSGDNLKSVAEIRDLAPLRKPLRDFVDWVARWTLRPRRRRASSFALPARRPRG